MSKPSKSSKVLVCTLCAKPVKVGCEHEWKKPFDAWSKAHMAELVGHIGHIQHPGS